MPRRKIADRGTRKLLKLGNGSVAVTLPIEYIRELRWQEKQRVTVRRRGKSLIIEDWKG